MKTQLSPRDWQQLSDFLDAQLNPRDQAELKKRLVERADLQAGLEELKQTRAVLRAAPHRRAPRNFTLTPAMVPLHRKVWRGWTPTFSFASVAAALVAGVMMLGQLMPKVASAPMLAAAPVSAPMEMPAAEALTEATPMIITWGNTSPSGMGGGGGGGADVVMGTGLGGGPATAPDFSTDKAMQPTMAATQTEVPVDPFAQPTPTVVIEKPQPTQIPAVITGDSSGTENLIQGIPPTEEQGLIRTPETFVAETQREVQPVNWMPWFATGLLAVAIGFAILAIRLRRR